jgi:hypothetical protein
MKGGTEMIGRNERKEIGFGRLKKLRAVTGAAFCREISR